MGQDFSYLNVEAISFLGQCSREDIEKLLTDFESNELLRKKTYSLSFSELQVLLQKTLFHPSGFYLSLLYRKIQLNSYLSRRHKYSRKYI